MLAVVVAAVIGFALGTLAPDAQPLGYFMDAARTGFLGALKLIVGPLIFFSLLSGLLQLRAAVQIRRLGGVTLLCYLGTTGIAILIGLVVVLGLHPWTAYPPLVDLPPQAADVLTRSVLIEQDGGNIPAVLLGLLSSALTNPIAAFAQLNILALVTNGVLFGLAMLIVLPGDSPVVRGVHDLTAVIYRIARWAVLLVPVGVLGIAYNLAGAITETLMAQIAGFMAVVFGATAFHGLVALPLLAWLLTGHTPLAFLRAVSAPATVALTTSSSAATLPVSLQTAQERLGVAQPVASFVLPLGATVNMDGTALFEGIAAVFLAYLFGVSLGPAGLIVLFFVAMIASVGAPGIPSGSMAGMQVVLLAVGIPLEAIGILLLIERPLDTFRTAVNVEGDLLACLIANRYGGATHGE